MVVRLRLTARQHRSLADNLDAAQLSRGARELRRAATRPGLLAELTAGEIYALEERVHMLPPATRDEVVRQAAVAREGELREERKRREMQRRHRALREQLGSAG